MKNLTVRLLVISALSIGFGAPNARSQNAMKERLASTIEGEAVSIRGNVHPMARAQYDQGRVDPSFKMARMSIIFQPTAAQQSELSTLLAQQQNPSSPNFHKWLAPEDYANRFGVTPGDTAKVLTWLQKQGFTVVETARSRNWVAFEGTAAQVEAAFHSEIHNYVVAGQSFYANSGEPSVPGDMAGIVSGIRSLNNFPLKPRSLKSRELDVSVQPNFTSSVSGGHFVTPGDLATIYDLKPLYAASPAIDGTGQRIAIVGQTNIVAADIAKFRSLSGLSANAPTTVLVPGTTDPGVVDGDIQEASLDIEWAGAVARNATIVYVYAPNVGQALLYAVDQNVAPVISTSYGSCEASATNSGLSATVMLAQQANAQGITIVAATGDTGAADCDGDLPTPDDPATLGLNVDLPSSLPYVTAIGGTEFNEGNGAYWQAASGSDVISSALSYIPEGAWNDTTSSKLNGTGGGASWHFAKPTWQTGSGVPNDGARDTPDISLNASPNHDGYLICSRLSGSTTISGCQNGFRNSSSDNKLTVFGGTSFGAPIFAGIVALINQKTASSGQGNLNYALYPLAAATPSAFHDVTTGVNGFAGNEVPCMQGTPDCPNGGFIGYNATTGYDLATGLGSVDASVLVSAWSTATVPAGSTPTLTSIAPTMAAAGSGDFTLTAVGTNFASNAQILWNGSASGVAMLSSAPGTLTATVSHTLIAYGGLGFVSVSNPGPTGGDSSAQTFTVTSTPPLNDNFANAIAIASVPFSGTVDNSGATTEATDPTPASSCVSPSTNPRTRTVWWSFTATAAGPVTADTFGSPYDTTLSVWTGLPGSLAAVACNDDIVTGSIRQSRVTFTAAAGTKYYFMVAPFGPPDTGADLLGGKTVLNVSLVSVVVLSASPSSQTISAGSSATYQITNSSSSAITVTCSGLPTGAACSPLTVNTNSTAALTITTTSRGGISPMTRWPQVPISAPIGMFAVGMALLSLALFKIKSSGRRRILAYAPLGLLMIALIFMITACGGSTPSNSVTTPPPTVPNPNGTPAGTYTIVISGAPSQSTSVILKVT